MGHESRDMQSRTFLSLPDPTYPTVSSELAQVIKESPMSGKPLDLGKNLPVSVPRVLVPAGTRFKRIKETETETKKTQTQKDRDRYRQRDKGRNRKQTDRDGDRQRRQA